VLRGTSGRNGRVEHAAESDAIDIAGMDTKTNDAARKLIVSLN
jgi:hypothetical protein